MHRRRYHAERAAALACAVAAAALAASGAVADPPPIAVTHGVRCGSLPKGVTLSPDGTRLYVTNYGQANAGNVAVFDATDLRRIGALNVPGIVVESAIAPDGRTLYVSNFSRNSVQFVDLARQRVVREVVAGSHPKILVLSHDGRRLFAANWGSHTVTEIDTATGQVVRTLRAGRNPRGMAFTRSGRLYVANFNGHSIDVYDGPDLSQHHRLADVCHIPRHLALSPDETRLYITCFSASELAVMRTGDEQIERRVPVGHWPKAVDVSPDGRFVYTANYGGSSVSIVDTADWTASTLDIPSLDHASGVAAARTGVRFFATGWYDGHLFAIDADPASPRYTVSDAVRALTLRRREYHRTHPVE
jgi:YVTN family beta-propeller protein